MPVPLVPIAECPKSAHPLPSPPPPPPHPTRRPVAVQDVTVGAPPLKVFEVLFANESALRTQFLNNQARGYVLLAIDLPPSSLDIIFMAPSCL